MDDLEGFHQIYSDYFPENINRSKESINLSMNFLVMNSSVKLRNYFRLLFERFKNKTDGKYYYYGTTTQIQDKIEPSMSETLRKKVVMASDEIAAAIIFSVRWGKKDFDLTSKVNGNPMFILKEMKPGAFESKLNIPAYIYCMDPKDFKYSRRVIENYHGFISENPVKILKTIPIDNVLHELENRPDIQLEKF